LDFSWQNTATCFKRHKILLGSIKLTEDMHGWRSIWWSLRRNLDQCSHQVGRYQRGSLWNSVTLLGMIHVFSDIERKDEGRGDLWHTTGEEANWLFGNRLWRLTLLNDNQKQQNFKRIMVIKPQEKGSLRSRGINENLIVKWSIEKQVLKI